MTEKQHEVGRKFVLFTNMKSHTSFRIMSQLETLILERLTDRRRALSLR